MPCTWCWMFVIGVVSFCLSWHQAEVWAQCVVTAPENLLPVQGLVVTNPPGFSWMPGQNNQVNYLNVSTSPDMDQLIDLINWTDDGRHYYSGEPERFFPRAGQTLYWRVVADGCDPVQRAISPVLSFIVGDTSQDPYYFVINIGWPGGSYSEYGWNPFDPASIDAADLLDLINNRIQTRGTNADKKLAFSFVIPYTFIDNPSAFVPVLQKLFLVSQESNLPLLIGLDGYEWWRGKPDLWNWWDPSLPGYNVNNRANVEWTGWSQDQAVQYGWRNWGSPFKTLEPHPNITSPAVILADQQALQALGAIIRDWHNGLPIDKKYLFAGIRLGWEVSIGINYFYPIDEAPCLSGSSSCNPFSNAHQVGYAAVSTAGLGNSGTLTSSQLTAALRIYMDALAQSLYDLGIPRRKIFLHIGADDNPSGHPDLVFAGTDAALTAYAHPGFSFYTYANGPNGMFNLEGSLGQISETFWSVSEWGGPGGGNWLDVINQFYHYHNNKFINVFVVADNTSVQQKLDDVSCWIHPPVLQAQVSGRQVILSWSAPAQAQQVYINISTNPQPSITGGFASVDTMNTAVTGQNSLVRGDLANGSYYWKLFADGCGRRVISDLGSFSIPEPGCGNGVADPGEICGEPGLPVCPIDCDDSNPCTSDLMTGSAQNCNAACSHSGITQCQDNDSCCPEGCFSGNDNDCSASCGNGVAEGQETCDGTDLRSASCESLGYQGGGSLSCNGSCQLDTSNCIGDIEHDGGQADGQDAAADQEREDSGFTQDSLMDAGADDFTGDESQTLTDSDAIEQDSVSGGCGCQSTDAEPLVWLGFLVLGLWGTRIRIKNNFKKPNVWYKKPPDYQCGDSGSATVNSGDLIFRMAA